MSKLSELALDGVGVGVFAVDRTYRIVLWNRFMQEHSGLKREQVLGRSLFDCFPGVPREWLQRKFDSVFLLKNSSFTSWMHRPYLFAFEHDRPITAPFDHMLQDCKFVPLLDGDAVLAVCVTVSDVTELASAWREKEEAVEALRAISERDALTGLFNRRHLEQRLEQEYARWLDQDTSFSIVIFDVDHFKSVNDRFGHAAGDFVLTHVAHVAGAQLGASDVLARYGGEEFVVILPRNDLDGALAIAEKIRASIAEYPLEFDGTQFVVTVSAGVGAVFDGLGSGEALVRIADNALYDAKRGGRNRVCAASSSS